VKEIEILLKEVEGYYKKEGRAHLPWRKTHDPYKILVSEIMLQQTQASRVVPFYNNFLKQFPTPEKLSKAQLSKVLKAWQGLGYNRRAKYLQEAAKVLSKESYKGQKLPGVGPYTKGAIDAFAFNKSAVFIETNIRTVFIYFCFSERLDISSHPVSDTELLPLVEKALQKSKLQPRDFYAALMDYGSYLKGQGLKLNSKSKHYVKQSKFKGSSRELRGKIIRELLKGPQTLPMLIKNLSHDVEEVKREVERLKKEGMIKSSGQSLSL
jgi:A/G-specific adenine glycosylase